MIAVRGEANATANKDVVPELFECVVIYSDSAIITRSRSRGETVPQNPIDDACVERKISKLLDRE